MEARKHYVEDRGWCYDFNDLDGLASYLVERGLTLSPTGITKVAKCLNIPPREVRRSFGTLGVPDPITTKDMVGKTARFGTKGTVTSFVRRARDGHGSPGTVFEFRAPDGTIHWDFVHAVNQNTKWWE